ncbi:hypothetical protein AAZX31_13G182700 [Glycine max]
MRKFEYTADSVVGLPLKSNISHHDLKAQFEFDEDFFTTWMSWPFVMALLAKTALMVMDMDFEHKHDQSLVHSVEDNGVDYLLEREGSNWDANLK